MTPTPIEIPVRAYLQPDGWVLLAVDPHDLPAAYVHRTTVPKLAVSVNGDDPQYLGPHGLFEQEKAT